MSKAVSKKAIDETQTDNYLAGLNYGKAVRAGINAFREFVIAWRSGNLEATRLLSLMKREKSADPESVLIIPAFLRKKKISSLEWEKQNISNSPKSFKPKNHYRMDKTIEILIDDGFLNSVSSSKSKTINQQRSKS